MDKFNVNSTVDCNGEKVEVGSAVCVLTAGNFIYGHVIGVNDNGTVKVVPDIGYNSTKPNFRLKKFYEANSDTIGVVNDDVIVKKSDNVISEVAL